MESFADRIAVITGGGTGMGQELARQLSSEGCHVALCDVSVAAMDETRTACLDSAPDGTRVTAYPADVAAEEQVLSFRDAVATDHDTDHIHLLFNNAGIGGGGSLVAGRREEWDRVFAVDWGGVYHGTRAFLPMLLAAEEGHVINTSSVNGFYAALGPNGAHTAYSAAKFAVKGFTEALLTDFRVNAPHLHAHVVMPGHIGTSIVTNSDRILSAELPAEESAARRREMVLGLGVPMDTGDEQALADAVAVVGEGFRTLAPTSAAEAARVILDGVRQNRWRILVGDDAAAMDVAVRSDPEQAYHPEFWTRLQDQGHFSGARR